MKIKSFFFVLTSIAAFGQVSSNQSLSGKYYFRQVLLTTDGTANVTAMHSAAGVLTFDGNGNFTISNAQQLAGTSAPSSLTGNGTYAVKPGGFATMTNPLQPGATINARLGVTALVGSSTEAGPTIFDLFVAIPAPSQATSISTLNGVYWVSSLELPSANIANIRDSNFSLTATGSGSFAETSVTGQAQNLKNHLQTQTVSPMTYTIAGDGSGTLTFPTAAGLDTTTQLIAGVKNIYVAQDGSYFVGGSMTGGLHGLVVGVKAFSGAATNASWSGFYFAAGMRYDAPSLGFPNARLAAVSGSVHANADGNSIWARRTRQSDGLFDAAPLITYNLAADGSGAQTSATGHVDLASTAKTFATSGVDVADSLSYEIYFGSLMPPQSGSGVFLNPQGIFNTGSFAPPGYPIAPGEFLTMFGTGFGTQSVTAQTLPLQTTLGGVQVSVNGISAPVYAVAQGSSPYIDAIVPFGVSGSTATIVVSVNNVKSNSVEVPLSATAPGVFSIPATGIAEGAIRHLNGTIANAASPAARDEVVSVYVGGLGAVTPTVPDGAATPTGAFYNINSPVNVYVGGQLVTNVVFAGLVPTLAGLYQLNIQIPDTVDSGPQSLAVQTNQTFTDMVTIHIK